MIVPDPSARTAAPASVSGQASVAPVSGSDPAAAHPGPDSPPPGPDSPPPGPDSAIPGSLGPTDDATTRWLDIPLDADLAARMTELARRCGVLPAMVPIAGLALLLRRYTGRAEPAIRWVETVYRLDLTEDRSIRELLLDNRPAAWLPGYPFQRRRHWIEPPGLVRPGGGTVGLRLPTPTGAGS